MSSSDIKTSLKGAAEALAACVALSSAGAAVELVILWREKAGAPLMTLSPDYFWSVPFALLVVALGFAAIAWVGVRWRGKGPVAALFVCTTVTFFDLLLLVPRLSSYAALLLAAGIGVQLARSVARSDARVRAIARLAPVSLAALVAAALFVRLSQPVIAGAAPSVRPSRGPNVLLITLDTVRAASMTLYGYERDTTPHLARYAARGVVFQRAFSTAPWTLPAHGSLFTGRFAHELSADYGTPLDDRFPTIAEYFRGRGYATGGFVANLEYCGRYTGLARGFDHYEDYPRTLGQIASNSTLLRSVADNFSLRRLLRNDEHLNRVMAPEQNRRLLAWLDQQGETPFFAFVNYFDAHEPYLPPPPFDRKFGPGRAAGRHSPVHHAMWNPAVPRGELSEAQLREERDAYDNALAYLDSEVGKLFEELDRRGLLERTLVVVTADHGEEFGEHRVLQHGYSLYRESLEVPLMMLLPGSTGSSRRVRTPVTLRDVPATIADVASGNGSSAFPGESLRRLWSIAEDASSDAGREALLSELKRPPGDVPEWYPVAKGDMSAVLHNGVRYIRSGDGSEELYDLDADPGEMRNMVRDPAYRVRLDQSRATLERLLASGKTATNAR